MAEKLTDVPYIGEKSERELRRAIKSDRPTGNFGSEVSVTEATKRQYRQVVQAKLNKRQRQELGKVSGAGELALLTREEKTDISRQQQSGTTEKSERKGVGDFMVNRSQQKEAFEQHQERSPRAKDVDEQRRATVTTDFETWSDNPDRFDYPGIDTPKRKPREQDQDKPFVSPNDLRAQPDDTQGYGVNLPGFGGTANTESTQNSESERQRLDLPDQTLATLRTGLNERTDDYFDAYEPNNQDRLTGIKERISIGEPLELSPGEFQDAKRILKDERDRAEDRAERMDRNIFGDTSEQADRVNAAFQGLINNPPR
jgi:hypothetical protein